MPTVTLTTADHPGAVALIQLHGAGAIDTMNALTGRDDPADGRLRLRDLGGIDEGLTVALRDDWAQLMPHGGPRVVALLIDRLTGAGVTYDAEPEARALYPEAGSAIEADMLAAIARAASPAAIDRLAAQPALWRGVVRAEKQKSKRAENRGGSDFLLLCSSALLLERSATLDRLLTPPTVVVVGRPNVGKSTLANAVMGRSVSLVSDLPGATRDWVGGLAEIDGRDTPGVAVRWLDTPGLRHSDDTVEQRAIALARRVVADADVLIAMRDPDTDWPDGLPRDPDLWVVNKCDEPKPHMDMRGLHPTRDEPLHISAERHLNLDALQDAIVSRLGLDDVPVDQLWAFSPTLRRCVEARDFDALRAYVAGG